MRQESDVFVLGGTSTDELQPNPAGRAPTTPASTIQNQLQWSDPELCVYELPEDGADVEMASARALAEVVHDEQSVAGDVVDQDERDEEHGRCSKRKSKTFTAIQTARS